MKMIKMVALPFTFLAAAVMHGGCLGAESGQEAEKPMAEAEPTAEVAAAASSSSCPGVRIEHIQMKSGSTILAFLDIFFDSSTGNNCAMTVANGPASGHASFIDVCLFRCKETSPGPTCTADAVQCDPNQSDPGPFHFFAGPVSVHAPGRCISAFGDLTFNGVTVSGDLVGAAHCG